MKSPFQLSLLLLVWLPLFPQSLAQTSLAAAISELPKCALSCLVTAIQNSPCSATNQTCLCTNAPLQASVTLCVSESCTIKQALFTKNITESSCGAPVRDRSTQYSTISTTFGVLSSFTVLARILFKLIVTTADLGLDDWFILITLIVGVPSSVLNVRGLAANGIGRDVWTLPYDNITRFVHVFYFMEVLYFAQVALLKLSLLFFYLRIFPGPQVKRLLWSTVAFDVLFGISFVFVAIFQCHPINYYWHSWDGEHQGKCVNVNAMGWANAVISILLDAWMLAIPLFQLVHLKLHWKKKIGVGLMFFVGTFVTVVSILRLQSLVAFAKSSNPTWDQWAVANWSTIEINVGIMCACMPAMRVILVRLFPKIMGSTNQSRKQYYNSYGNNSKSRSRSGTQTYASAAPQPSINVDKKNIMYTKSYNVEYDDHDETRLVQLQDLDIASVKPKSNSSDVDVDVKN